MGNWRIKISVLSVLPKFITSTQFLFNTKIRANTIPSNSAIVSTVKYLGIGVLYLDHKPKKCLNQDKQLLNKILTNPFEIWNFRYYLFMSQNKLVLQ